MGVTERAAGVSFVVLFVVAVVSPVSAFSHGDPVPMVKRLQFQKMRSAWTDMHGDLVPRFGVPHSAELPNPSNEENQLDLEYKVAFSFDRFHRFTTPWILIQNDKGLTAHTIEVIFKYTGHEIKEIKWNAEYSDLPKEAHAAQATVEGVDDVPETNVDPDAPVVDPDVKKQSEVEKKEELPEHITLVYEWVEVKEKDSNAAMLFLFISGFGMMALMLVVTLLDTPMIYNASFLGVGSPVSNSYRETGRVHYEPSRHTSQVAGVPAAVYGSPNDDWNMSQQQQGVPSNPTPAYTEGVPVFPPGVKKDD